MRRVLITGANRGLGLELTQQCLGRGDRVFATRRPESASADLEALGREAPTRLTILDLDVTDDQALGAALSEMRDHVSALDVLFNNAGIMDRDETPETLDREEMLHAFHVNTVSPALVIQGCLDLLADGNEPRVINISSQLGSLANKRSGGYHSYCASKAALNMMSRALAYDLKPRGIIVVAIHPGWVKTSMGGSEAPLSPEESIRGVLAVSESLTLQRSGRFVSHEGERMPW